MQSDGQATILPSIGRPFAGVVTLHDEHGRVVASGLAVCLEVFDMPGGSRHLIGSIESAGRYRLVLDGDGYCVVNRVASFTTSGGDTRG